MGAKIKEIQGEEKSAANVSYFRGNDPSKWKPIVSTYDLVNLGEVYEGIDLKLKAYDRNVEKLFFVQPGADPKQIQVSISGANKIWVNEQGEMVLETEMGEVAFTKPIAYQEIDGKKKEVEVAYVIARSESDEAISNASPSNPSPITHHSSRIYAFHVGEYDTTKELIIDPLLYSTYLGGSGNDYSLDAAVDSAGNLYVIGWTESSDFPTQNPYQGVYAGNRDVYVAKFNAAGSALVFSTYLGGNNDEYGRKIALYNS